MAKSKSVSEDEWIDYYLFAYNSIPTATTGHSPHELIFGHSLHSPLMAMRESWLHGQRESIKSGKDVLSYMTELRERLEAATDAAEAEARKQTQRHKEIYDRQSTVRELAVDDKVLILQPISSFKLLATWSGPYVVTKRLNNFNYEIDMGQRKNMPKRISDGRNGLKM